ncbi:MAG: hypothetical protein R3F14_11075 [Polyangiaceae bacterium]
MRSRWGAIPLCACLALLLSPVRARAEGEEEALAKGKKLYDEAVVLLEKKSYSEACPKLEEAVRLVPVAVGARLALAECDEGRGKLASALSGYRKAQSMASTTGQGEREELAKRNADRLEKKVGTLRIEVAPGDLGLAELAIEVDGAAAAAGQAVPADSGKRTVRAKAKGRAAFEQVVEVADGKETAVAIVLAPEKAAGGGKPGG